MLEQADRLADEARRLSGAPDMPWPHALEYLAARGRTLRASWTRLPMSTPSLLSVGTGAEATSARSPLGGRMGPVSELPNLLPELAILLKVF
jgi:hypothetical protein